MRRAALERPRTIRVWLSHNREYHDSLPTRCRCDEQPGRFRKGERIGGGCSSHCPCKLHKRLKAVVHRDYRAAHSYREQVVEYGFHVRMPARWW